MYAAAVVCPTELVAFSDRASEFSDINTKVVAISTDSHHTHLAWIRTKRVDGGLGGMNIPLVADISKEISRAYGVLVEDPEDDMYGAALRYEGCAACQWPVALREAHTPAGGGVCSGLFVIDPQGIIRSIQINDDQVGRSVTETVRLIKAFQFADEHKGEVCVVGRHGQPAMPAQHAECVHRCAPRVGNLDPPPSRPRPTPARCVPVVVPVAVPVAVPVCPCACVIRV